MASALSVVVLAGLAAACQREKGAGQERQECRPDHTCDVGLQCLSNLCVRPPPADCSRVAETLASIEVGNYASMEERAPSVARHRAECETAVVSKDEGECIDKATDTWSAARCVPRMFPKVQTGGTGDCAEVTARTRQAIRNAMGQTAGSAELQMVDKMMPIMQQSCEQDGWPPDIKQCIIASPPGDMQAMQKCSDRMPKQIQDKISQRMMAVTR